MKGAVVLLGLALAGAAAADEGRRPIDSRTVITEPGSYIVTRGFTTSVDAILVQADGVTIDLNGQTIATTGSLPVINIQPAVVSTGITIRNGRLSGGGFGVFVATSGNGPMRFEELTVEGASVDGFYLFDTPRFEIVDCSIRDVAGYGIQRILNTPGNNATARLERNLIHDVGEAAISLESSRGAVIADNVIRSTGNGGILITGRGARVVRNTIYGAGGQSPAAGIALPGDGALVQDNVIVDGEGIGISVTGFNSRPALLVGNTVSGHAGHGIELSVDDALVEGNQVMGNDGFGLYVGLVGAFVPYRNNMLRDNVAGSVGELVAGVVDDQGGNICDGSCP